MNFLVKFGAGFFIKQAAPWISKRIKNFFESYVKVAEDNIKNIPELLEEKSGIDLFPAETQQKWDLLVDHVVEFVESATTDQAKIRFVLNALMRNEVGLSKEILGDWAGKSWQEFLASLPPELKATISAAKENLATNLLESIWQKLTGQAAPPREAIRASITNVVAAKNANQPKVEAHIAEESFSATWERLCRESKERQAAMVDKPDAK
jgi:hypothetical protein